MKSKVIEKIVTAAVAAALALTLLSGCSGSKAGTDAPAQEAPAAADATQPSDADAGETSSFDTSKNIAVVSREDGSGTRGAFIELFKVEVKGDDGSKKDMTTKEAVIAKQTDVMMTNVANDQYAIGYISLGSLNDTVKAVTIDGVTATPENVKSGDYTAARPFNIVTKGQAQGLAADFIAFILSADGQAVISGNKYIAIDEAAAAYAGQGQTGRIVVAGSSSVTPVMEKLKEAYIAINPDAEIEIQQSDSSAGMIAAMEGTCDIGMASRELKEEEAAELTPIQIALDGIAVIVNNANPTADLTKEQVRAIFTGEYTAWDVATK